MRGWRGSVQHPALQPRAPRVAASQKPIARWSADAIRSVGVCEAHPLCGEAVEVRSRYFGLGVIRSDVPVAKIVGQDYDDIGVRECWSRQAQQGGKT